ncbi:bifunctional helix-turn-helix transcriptional regulator/GNAT family N-acetyltransferase [Phenylobacterium sp.]|jgi:DNA-binding MarR family transcriptional regulator/GNAT superfamily N-acetyltransferase|uniref:bifunctional helix-turn-helix transcriptional regulator/GNAT family N-acetyltransferase n=1 Tax=Phenylobacterium sp. TaxID=1871053 RepID=UPI002F3F2474
MSEGTHPVTAVRRFNRFYTSAIGVLDRRYLGSPYGVAEGRVLYEIATGPGGGEGVTPKRIGEITRMDAGQLSRIVGKLERDGLVARRRSATDGRSIELSLTPDGAAMFAGFNQSSAALAEQLIGGLSAQERRSLVDALETAQDLLTPGERPPAPIVLRGHAPGDMGWITERHGVIYGREYGWGPGIEAVTARVCADFLEHFDPDREHCWIAERAGERVGCVFIVKDTAPETARLRLLMLEPSARGTGLGRRLVEECVRFSREAGYREIVLWTHAVLTAARRIYAAQGFEIVETWEHDEFGAMEVSETWRLRL